LLSQEEVYEAMVFSPLVSGLSTGSDEFSTGSMGLSR
jgi:hypothetical protein